jgi:hypothetical protein
MRATVAVPPRTPAGGQANLLIPCFVNPTPHLTCMFAIRKGVVYMCIAIMYKWRCVCIVRVSVRLRAPLIVCNICR